MTEETLFHLALQQPASERAAFLEKLCAGDDALRQRVAALLQAAEHPGDFLGSPLGATVDEPRRAEGPGTCIGSYKLLQQIGEGGMGVVFMAEQTEPVRRMVALKVIKQGMDTHQVIARFEAERQALALMDHPNIAKVLGAGATEAGRPYFVMELVKGVPITKYCDEHRLTPRQRLELFIPVCQAVQHAHQKGIIHRDLKPSNVLIASYDGKPVPKVIDFGVAKATGQKLTDKTLFTDFGAVVGTLEYMSPEQAELNQLDIDTRSDLYSLGVLLYELLTGTTPLESKRLRKAAMLECLRIIREEEPPRPSTRLSTTEELPAIAAKRGLEPRKLSGQLRGDLDWIAMKCLEKDRNRRYETANGLALDVQRYLADEPVLASPPSPLYRLGKFARRHKAGLLATTAALVVLVLAICGVGWVLWDRAAQDTARRADLAGRRANMEKAVLPALAKADQLGIQAEGLPLESSTQAQAALVVYQQALDALGQAEAALQTGVADDHLRQQVENLGGRLTQSQQRVRQRCDQTARREKLFRDLDAARLARAILVDLHFDNDSAAAKYAAAFAEFGLQVQLGQTGVLAERIRSEEPALRDALIVGLDDWAYGSPPPFLRAGLLAIAQAADEDAWRRDFRRAVMERDSAALVHLAKEARHRRLAPTSLQLLAEALEFSDRHEEARDLLRWARGLHPTDFWIALDLGNLLDEAKTADPLEMEERIGCYRVAVALRPDAGPAHYNLGVALKAKGQLDDAIAEYQKAIDLDPKFAPAHNNLGVALKAKGQLDDAIAEYHKAIDLDPKHVLAHYNLGLALYAKQQPDDAIAEFKKAIDLDPKYAPAHADLGVALQAKGQLDAAIAEYQKAINLDPKYVLAHVNLGFVLKAKGQLDDAIAEFKKAIGFDPKFALAHYNLGLTLYAKQQPDDAIAEFKKAIDLDPKYAPAHADLGLALYHKQQLDDAIAEFTKAINLDSKFARAHTGLGLALKAKGQLDDAIAEYKIAIDLDSKLTPAHGALGSALLAKGRFTAAKASTQMALDLLSEKDPLWPLVERQRANCDALLALEAKLPDILAGKAQPKDQREWFGFLEVCRLQQRHAAAAKLYGDAFTTDAKLADDLKAGHRYNAACSAALAAAGQGTDADKLDDKERARLRKQALDWLRADLDLWTKRLADAKPPDRQALLKTLKHWQEDRDLSGVRDAKALEKLPADEREACQKLWSDVAELLKKAAETK